MNHTRTKCPGDCGGEAVIEAPMTTKKDGVTKTVYPVRCRSGACHTLTRRHGNLPKKVAKTFYLDSLPEQTVSPVPVQQVSHLNLRSRMRKILDDRGLPQTDVSRATGVNVTTVRKWLRGQKIAAGSETSLARWIDSVERGELKPVSTKRNRPGRKPAKKTQVDSALEQRFRAALRRTGLTVQEIGEHLGFPKKVICAWKSGSQNTLSEERLAALVDWIERIESQPQRKPSSVLPEPIPSPQEVADRLESIHERLTTSTVTHCRLELNSLIAALRPQKVDQPKTKSERTAK